MIKFLLIIIFLVFAIVDVIAVVSNSNVKCIKCAYFLICKYADENINECENFKLRRNR